MLRVCSFYRSEQQCPWSPPRHESADDVTLVFSRLTAWADLNLLKMKVEYLKVEKENITSQ